MGLGDDIGPWVKAPMDLTKTAIGRGFFKDSVVEKRFHESVSTITPRMVLPAISRSITRSVP